ncbi:MAG TPA: sugar phosphate nucleotidyltransferase, partial [Actinomycetota bacterium]|nr:sugar phosphate nucleotidyltransferase [Actinomycetota bacterium]
VYLFDSRVHAAVRALAPSPRGELEITDAIQRLVDLDEPVRVHHVTGWWKDTGHKEDLLEANRLVLETITPRIDGFVDDATTIDGAVVVEPGARVTASVLRGPLIVGADVVVDDSEIGPYTSIGARCRVAASVVENSVVMEECDISGVRRLLDSLLGRGVVVEGARGDRPVRLMVGDHGYVSC